MQRQIAAGAIAGAALGLLYGYGVYAGGGAHTLVNWRFDLWLSNSNIAGPTNAFWLGLTGAAAGAAVAYLLESRHNSN
jgi:hypothetical protein